MLSQVELELEKLLRYEPETGKLFWKACTSNRVKVGAEAGTAHCNGYRAVRVRGKFLYVHRVAWWFMHRKWPEVIDHINGVRDDNRLANLRSGSQEQNAGNRRESVGRTGLLGVTSSYRSGKPFMAQITTSGKTRTIGYFWTAQEAHEAYLQAKRREHDFCTI